MPARTIGRRLSSRRFATLLGGHREELLRQWSRRLREAPAAPEAVRLGEPRLREHVPALLDGIIHGLEAADSGEASGRAIGASVAVREHAQHGAPRELQIKQTLRELSLLRAVILELCVAEGVSLENDAAGLLSAAIDESMSTCATEMERVAAEALRRQADLFDQSHDAVLLWRLGGQGIVSWNRGAEELYGWSASEAIGRISHDLLQTEQPSGMTEIEQVLLQQRRCTPSIASARRTPP